MIKHSTRRRLGLTIALSLAALPFLGAARERRLRYNSEEHRLIVDRGVAAVKIPASVHFPQGIARRDTTQGAFVGAMADAKRVAKQQDDCYNSAGFAQAAGNNGIYVPTPQVSPNALLVLDAYTSSTLAGRFSMGQLAALYGDYRRTTYCDTSYRCFLTDAEIGNLTFTRGKGTCPTSISARDYLAAISMGMWTPYGDAGNAFTNTADDNEYGDAGWWGDEMVRIANANDWHWSNGAIAWYVGLHRLALVHADSARVDPRHWMRALHYEANALHALTDLFAFGHVMTNRDVSSYGIFKNNSLLGTVSYKWMDNVIQMGGGNRDEDGRITLGSRLPTIKDVASSRNDFMKTSRGSWGGYALYEHDYHEKFNAAGGNVRNLNGTRFRILGDAGLSQMVGKDSALDVLTNAVTASVQSLFDGFDQLTKNGSTTTIGQVGSPYFAALKFVPVYIERDGTGHYDGYWTLYADAVNKITGTNKTLGGWKDCQIPYLSGADWRYPAGPRKNCAQF
jgi:hypothetical protein